jgi:hypothetical protein
MDAKPLDNLEPITKATVICTHPDGCKTVHVKLGDGPEMTLVQTIHLPPGYVGMW